LAKQLKAVGKNVVVTATTGIAAQGHVTYFRFAATYVSIVNKI
jgi:hypothetical protein